jgi:AhpC/TSA family
VDVKPIGIGPSVTRFALGDAVYDDARVSGERAMGIPGVGRIALAAALLGIGLWMMPLSARGLDVGDQAPNFLMHSTVGETVRLSNYQGKKHVLLFFFLAAFTRA